MKTNRTMMVAFCLLVVFGCGLLGKKGVPNEQINADLNGKTVKFNGGSNQWYFSPDYERCFTVNDQESKINDSNADLSVKVSSWYQSDITKVYTTVIGNMLMHYRKDGDKWTLASIEPKDLKFEGFSELDDFKKFLDKHTPVCKGYRHTSY